MTRDQRRIKELTEELNAVKARLSEAESQLGQQNEQLGQYWERIQSMRLSNRLKSAIGLFKVKAFLHRNRANPFQENNTGTGPKIALKMPAPDWLTAPFWGDYYYALSLKKYLIKLGYRVIIQVRKEWEDNSGIDIALVLRGPAVYHPQPGVLNLMWNISHPGEVSESEYLEYQHIFIASEKYILSLPPIVGRRASVLLQCSDPELFYPDNQEKDGRIIFIGNSHGELRPVVRDVLDIGIDVDVYGTLWEELIDKKYIKRQHLRNHRLRHYYAHSGIVLNDHWPDMREFGFISNRVFDVLACNGRLLSDNIQGIPEDLKPFIHTYESKAELQALMGQLPQRICPESAPIIMQDHSFSNRASHIHKIITKLI